LLAGAHLYPTTFRINFRSEPVSLLGTGGHGVSGRPTISTYKLIAALFPQKGAATCNADAQNEPATAVLVEVGRQPSHEQRVRSGRIATEVPSSNR
jgi:hypothetical protein